MQYSQVIMQCKFDSISLVESSPVGLSILFSEFSVTVQRPPPFIMSRCLKVDINTCGSNTYTLRCNTPDQ